jgi:hypothetical protein
VHFVALVALSERPVRQTGIPQLRNGNVRLGTANRGIGAASRSSQERNVGMTTLSLSGAPTARVRAPSHKPWQTINKSIHVPNWVCNIAIVLSSVALVVQAAIDIDQGTVGMVTFSRQWFAQAWQMGLELSR